jgi:hypothetical protein
VTHPTPEAAPRRRRGWSGGVGRCGGLRTGTAGRRRLAVRWCSVAQSSRGRGSRRRCRRRRLRLDGGQRQRDEALDAGLGGVGEVALDTAQHAVEDGGSTGTTAPSPRHKASGIRRSRCGVS